MSPWCTPQGQPYGFHGGFGSQDIGQHVYSSHQVQGQPHFVGPDGSSSRAGDTNKSSQDISRHLDSSHQGQPHIVTPDRSPSRAGDTKQERRMPKHVKEERTSMVDITTIDNPTTICFKNIPNTYTNTMVLELLDSNGFKGSCDFIYVPHSFKRLPVLKNLGYFFVNFVSHKVALRAWERFTGFKEWPMLSDKIMVATWAATTQGQKACIERFQNSRVMRQSVPPECKPTLFENGVAVGMANTKTISEQTDFKTGYNSSSSMALNGHGLTLNQSEGMRVLGDSSIAQVVDDKENQSIEGGDNSDKDIDASSTPEAAVSLKSADIADEPEMGTTPTASTVMTDEVVDRAPRRCRKAFTGLASPKHTNARPLTLLQHGFTQTRIEEHVVVKNTFIDFGQSVTIERRVRSASVSPTCSHSSA